MKIPDKDKAIMSKFMQDLWSLIKNMYTADAEDDEFWREFIDLINRIANKYKDPETKIIPPAIIRLLVGYCDYLDVEGCGNKRDYIGKMRTPSPLEKYLEKQGLIKL